MNIFLIFLQVREQHPMMDEWGIGWPLMIIFWILIVALIATMIWFLIKRKGESDKRPSKNTPREILDERYARGEIDDDEYRRRKKELANR